MIADLHVELGHRVPALPPMPGRDGNRRRSARVSLSVGARLRVGELCLPGHATDVGYGGVFVRTHMLIESGERGLLELDDGHAVPVVVAWTRGSGHPEGAGLGLAFDIRDALGERRALELVLALLDAGH